MPRTPAVNVLVAGKYDGKDLERAYKDLDKLKKQVETSSDKFSRMGDKLKSIGSSVSAVGGQLTKSVTLPIVGIGAAAAAMSIEFESSMSKITGLVGIAADEVADMEAAVLELAGQTAKAPQELADALFVVTSAGLRGKDALDALEFAAKAGAAGLGETNDIARALAGSMNAYGADVVDAARATDVIVATARAGNFETSQFAGAIGRVLPFAKQAGASLEDMGGAVALLTRTNGDAAQSVTQVQALFRAFVVPTEEAKKALKGVGMSAADMRAAIEQDGLAGALTMLDDKLGGNREQLGKLLGSSEAAAAAFQILDADAQTIADTFGAVNNATGITGEAFDVVAETSGFKLQQAFTQIKATLIELGDIIAPFVDQFVSKLQGLIKSFQNLSPQQKQMIVLFGAIAAAIGPVLVIVGTLISALGAIVGAIGAISLPVVAVVAGIAAFVAVLVLLWTKSEAFRNGVINIWDAIRNAVSQVVDLLKKKLEENADTLNTLKQAFSTVWQFLNQYVIPAIAKFYEVYLSTLIKVLGAFIGGLIDAAANLVDMGVAAFNVGKKIFEFGKTVVSAIDDALDTIRELPDNVRTALGNAKDWLLQTGKDMIQGLLDGAGSILPRLGEFFLDKLPGWIVGPFKRALGIASPSKVFYGFGEDIIQGLTSALEQGGENVRETMQNAFVEKIKSVRAGLIEELNAQRQIFFDYAKDVSSAIMGNINFSEIAPEFNEDGERVGMTFLEGLKAQAEKVKEFSTKIKQLIAMDLSEEALQQVLSAGVNAGTRIADELIAGGSTAIQDTNDFVKSSQDAADEVGLLAAQQFKSAGVDSAWNTVKGFDEQFKKGGEGRKKLMQIMDNLAAAADREVRINVSVTRAINEVVTRIVSTISRPVEPRAAGGPVSAGSPYLIGEKGPELFVPDISGFVVPNAALATNTRAGLGSTINVTVNAGMGTDGAEVGRQVVDALKRYQRTNGPLPLQVA